MCNFLCFLCRGHIQTIIFGKINVIMTLRGRIMTLIIAVDPATTYLVTLLGGGGG